MRSASVCRSSPSARRRKTRAPARWRPSSQLDDSVFATATDTIIIAPPGTEAGVELTPDRSAFAQPGDVVTYTHTLANTGATTDTFALTLFSELGWATLLAPTSIELGRDEMVIFDIQIAVPTDAISGAVETTVLTATSQLDPNVFAAATDTTTVTTGVVPPDEFYLFLPIVARNYDG